MASERKDGGPAFPSRWENTGDGNARAPDGQIVPPYCTAYLQGMSLRDWFAGQALAGMSDDQASTMISEGKKVGLSPSQSIARLAFTIADAMLAECA